MSNPTPKTDSSQHSTTHEVKLLDIPESEARDFGCKLEVQREVRIGKGEGWIRWKCKKCGGKGRDRLRELRRKPTKCFNCPKKPRRVRGLQHVKDHHDRDHRRILDKLDSCKCLADVLEGGQEYTVQEISFILDIPEILVNQALERALLKLKRSDLKDWITK